MKIRVAASLMVAGVVAGCASSTPAPVVDRPSTTTAPTAPLPRAQQTPTPGSTATAPSPSAGSQIYVVKRGDTLYSIALDNGLDYRELALWNRLDDPSRIQVGQTLRLMPPEERSAVQVGSSRAPGSIESRPLESRPQEAARASASDAALKTEPKAQRLPYTQQNAAAAVNNPPPAAQPQPAAKPAPARPEPPQAADPDAADAIEFAWPARGRVIGEFSEPRNKGIDIAGRPGDPVVAAAAGRVTYTGTGIPGMGKLIVIRHDNNYLTIYAHNREVLVKEQQTVVRGQRIAELGSTDSDTPKLHFEIRRGARPIDPRKFLPGNP